MSTSRVLSVYAHNSSPPTSTDVKALNKLINELRKKEEKESVPLNTRECVLLGTAYEYGLCVDKDLKKALANYKKGYQLVNPSVSPEISNRDRGHALANACSLYDLTKKADFAQAFACGKEAVALGSEFGYAHLGHIYEVNGDYAKAKECLLKAPTIFFANGILGFIYRHEGKSDKAKLHWENAVSFGCPNSLKELISFYDSDPAKKMLITYEYASRLGNYTSPEMADEAKEAKTAFTQLAQEHPEFIEDKMSHMPWQRIAPLLDPQVAGWFAHKNSFTLAAYYYELIKHLPVNDVTELVIQYLFLAEYLDEAKAPVKRKTYLTFWEQNAKAEKVKNARHRRNSDPSGVSEGQLAELDKRLQPLGLRK